MLWIGQLPTDISQVGLTNFGSRLDCALKSAHVQYVIAALYGRGVAGGASGTPHGFRFRYTECTPHGTQGRYTHDIPMSSG